MSEPIKTGIVDDHKIVRDGLKAMMMGETDLRIIFEAADAENALNIADNIKPDVFLLDIMLPGMDGITLASKLKLLRPDAKMLMLSSNIDELTIVNAINAGVDGYLSKDASGDEVKKAIRTVASGEEYYGEKISAIVFKSFIARKTSGGSSQKLISDEMLSDREKEVIRCFGDGLSYKETASKLNISPRTVETHRNTIMEKLGMHSLAELIKFAIRVGIVKL